MTYGYKCNGAHKNHDWQDRKEDFTYSTITYQKCSRCGKVQNWKEVRK